MNTYACSEPPHREKDRQLTRKEMDWGQLSWGKCEDEKRRTRKDVAVVYFSFLFLFTLSFCSLLFTVVICACIYVYMHVLLLLLIFCMLECFLSLLNKKRGWVHGHLHHEAKNDTMIVWWHHEMKNGCSYKIPTIHTTSYSCCFFVMHA